MSAFALRLDVDRWVAGSADRVPGATVLRTPRFPSSWDLNQVVLDPGAGPEDVQAALELAERELDGLGHRRLTMPAPAGPVAVPAGWDREELLAMEWRGAAPAWPPGVVGTTAPALRRARTVAWHAEGAGEHAEELADMQVAFGGFPGARSVAVRDGDAFVAWAQVANGCIDDVYVLEERRGRGLGRAVTTAALAAGGWYLWTAADDPRPQGLYRSLGFVETGRIVQLTRHL